MLAARLHGPKDIRLDTVAASPDPGPGEAVVRITVCGVCGSDLHTYLDGWIGDTALRGPLVLGHEFAGVVQAVGPEAIDGAGRPLAVGQRVAVDPSQPCKRCELCLLGHPNLCPHHTFTGVAPTDGAFQQQLLVPADTCFPVPDALDDETTAMLEPFGVALHAIDLAHIRPGHSVAVIGAGTIGLLCATAARLAGASPLFVTDRLPWRLKAAEDEGAIPVHTEAGDPVQRVMQLTGGRGVDVALECAWSSPDAVAQAAQVLRPGGRLVIVGISSDDTLTFQHSLVRRKGLTIAMCRRMKHTYPRAIQLAAEGRVDLKRIITHRFSLEETASALKLAADYQDNVIKAMVYMSP